MWELHDVLPLLQVQLLQLRLWLLKLHMSLLHVHELLHVCLLLLLRQTVLGLLQLAQCLLHGPSRVLRLNLAEGLLHGADNRPAARAQHAGHGGWPCCWYALLRCAVR